MMDEDYSKYVIASDAEGGDFLWGEWSSKGPNRIRMSVYVPPGTTEEEKQEMLKYPGHTLAAVRAEKI